MCVSSIRMVDDLQVGRWFGPDFRKQPDPPPQSTFEQQTTQLGDALMQYADDSSRSARSAAMCVRQDLWRRSETTGDSAQIIGVFNSGPICQHQKCCHRQHQPMTTDSLRIGPSSLLPLPPNTLERLEAQLYPEAKCIPAHTSFSNSQVGHHDQWLVLVSVPYHDHRSTTTFARVPERCPVPHICMTRTRHESPRWQPSPPIRTEHGVDRLSCVGMPTHRAYLLPQSRTPQTTVTHHQHGPVLRHRQREQLQQVDHRRYPLSGPVGGQDVPCNRNGATAIDHTYDYGVYLVSLHRRVYCQHQPVRLPQRQHPPQQRNKARPHIKLHSTGLGTVSTIVEPLSEVLAHAVVTTHNHKGDGDSVLAATPGQYSPIHPQDQSRYLRGSEVWHVLFNGLLHLIAFRWKAHGESLATFLFSTKKMPESHALSKFLY